MSDKHATLENRDGFQSKWGFILACIGSAVGMGNIWRFPIMVQQFGGMTFLIPYFLFVLLIGSTGIIEEFALGRWAQGGPVISFGKATEERTGNKRLGEAIGALPIVGSMMLAIGYTVVMSWIFKYCWMGISGSLYAMGTDMATIGRHLRRHRSRGRDSGRGPEHDVQQRYLRHRQWRMADRGSGGLSGHHGIRRGQRH